ncbi:hypothetical protein MMC15_006761 [Xylographa vitiligo]|nr:hypothetical protein [Xylographa vitiligo]
MGQHRQEAVAQQRGHRQRHRHRLGGGEQQAGVLGGERHGRTRRLEALLDDQLAVVPVHRGVEEATGEDLEQGGGGDAALVVEGEHLGHLLDGREDHEVERELDEVGAGRVVAHVEDAPAELVERLDVDPVLDPNPLLPPPKLLPLLPLDSKPLLPPLAAVLARLRVLAAALARLPGREVVGGLSLAGDAGSVVYVIAEEDEAGWRGGSVGCQWLGRRGVKGQGYVPGQEGAKSWAWMPGQKGSWLPGRG